MAQNARPAAAGAASSPATPSPQPPTRQQRPQSTTEAPSSSPQTPSSSSFKFPHYYNFPPMYTLQPNLNTRRAQLDKWSALILAYCRHYRIFRLVPSSVATSATALGYTSGPVRVDGDLSSSAASPSADDPDTPSSIAYYAPDLFRNSHIDRAMPQPGIREVLQDMKRQGRIEFVDPQTTSAFSTWSSADAAADAAASLSCYVFWKTADEWAAAVEAFVDDTAQRGSVLTLYELTAGDATRGSELHGLDPVVLQRALAVLVKRGKAQVFGSEESLGVKFF